jgi:hypothetical protein
METGLRTKFELQTRDRYTKVEAELGLKVIGKELPNMAVLGMALEKAVEVFEAIVAESYKAVPPRATPLDSQNSVAVSHESISR